MTLATLASWPMTASESITHVSLWDNVSAGTFQESWQLTAPVPVVASSVFSLPTFTRAYTPIAA